MPGLPAVDASQRQPTLASVLAYVTASHELTPRQRQDLASALRTIGRVLQRSLDDVPANPPALRELLKPAMPAAVDISPRRWTNTTSLVRQAIRHAGITVAAGRSWVPFLPAWTALFRLVEVKHASIALSRLARYCTNHGIKPDAVNDAVFTAFLKELEATDMRQAPHKVHRQAAVVWNRMVSTSPAWPQRPITVPSYSAVYALPWERFPASLRVDLDAYLEHLASGSDILDAAAFKPLRPASVKAVKHQLTAYVSALVHRGHDPKAFRTLADVVALPLVKDGLRFFLDRAPQGSTTQAHGIAGCIRAAAQHWVGVKEEHVLALRQLYKRLDPGPKAMADKNRERLRQFDDPANVRKLLALPEVLVTQATRCKEPGEAEALWVQTALAVELLLMLPLRRRNLVRLDLDRHIRRAGPSVVHVVIPGDEVKNGAEIAAVLPGSVVQLMDLYLKRYRRLLVEERSPWLFPGVGDRPKSLERMSLQISGTIKREIGLLVNVHLFRHLSAKLYLDSNPGAYGVIRSLHGHKSVDTTTRFYCGAETGAAIEAYEQQVVALRGPEARARLAKAVKPTSSGRKRQ